MTDLTAHELTVLARLVKNHGHRNAEMGALFAKLTADLPATPVRCAYAGADLADCTPTWTTAAGLRDHLVTAHGAYDEDGAKEALFEFAYALKPKVTA